MGARWQAFAALAKSVVPLASIAGATAVVFCFPVELWFLWMFPAIAGFKQLRTCLLKEEHRRKGQNNESGTSEIIGGNETVRHMVYRLSMRAFIKMLLLPMALILSFAGLVVSIGSLGVFFFILVLTFVMVLAEGVV